MWLGEGRVVVARKVGAQQPWGKISTAMIIEWLALVHEETYSPQASQNHRGGVTEEALGSGNESGRDQS